MLNMPVNDKLQLRGAFIIATARRLHAGHPAEQDTRQFADDEDSRSARLSVAFGRRPEHFKGAGVLYEERRRLARLFGTATDQIPRSFRWTPLIRRQSRAS